MQNTYKKGFSLVELLVAMAIIAVLISIAAYGIGIVQKNSRDTRRRQIVSDLITDIVDNEGRGVLATGLSVSSTTVTIKGAGKAYPVSGFTTVNLLAGSDTGAGGCDTLTGTDDAGEVSIGIDTTDRVVCTLLEGGAGGFSKTY